MEELIARLNALEGRVREFLEGSQAKVSGGKTQIASIGSGAEDQIASLLAAIKSKKADLGSKLDGVLARIDGFKAS